MTDLATRAVACKGWRWMPGMLALSADGEDPCGRVLAVNGRMLTVPDCDNEAVELMDVGRAVPDLTDPATLGCLLALVRKAWDSSSVHLRPWYDRNGEVVYWQVLVPRKELYSHAWRCLEGPTEAAALVAALEAAGGK